MPAGGTVHSVPVSSLSPFPWANLHLPTDRNPRSRGAKRPIAGSLVRDEWLVDLRGRLCRIGKE